MANYSVSLKFILLLIVGLLPFIAIKVYANVQVSVSGCVELPKTIEYSSKVSLFQVLQDSEITNCAYMLGASWINPRLNEAQQKQKQALLKDINSMLAIVEGEAETDYLVQLKTLIGNQKVSGRVVRTDLDPFHVEMLPFKNRIVLENSAFHFPKMPSFIHLIGFLKKRVVYNSDDSIGDIYGNHAICDDCSHGWLWLVQPNGEVQKLKVGLWTNESYYLAPGGWLISPLSNSGFEEVAPEFYEKLTSWLATQVIQ